MCLTVDLGRQRIRVIDDTAMLSAEFHDCRRTARIPVPERVMRVEQRRLVNGKPVGAEERGEQFPGRIFTGISAAVAW